MKSAFFCYSTIWRRYISFFCFLALLLGILPVSASAADITASLEEQYASIIAAAGIGASLEEQYASIGPAEDIGTGVEESYASIGEAYETYYAYLAAAMEDEYYRIQFELEEELSYEADLIFRHFVSLKTNDERVKFFFGLPEYQRVLLVQYIRYLTEIGYFDGNTSYDVETSDEFVADGFQDDYLLKRGHNKRFTGQSADMIVHSIKDRLSAVVFGTEYDPARESAAKDKILEIARAEAGE